MARGFDAFVKWLNDWRGSTARVELSLAGRAAYQELMEWQYSYGGKGVNGLPNSDTTLARLIGCPIEEWLAVKDDVLRYFDVNNDGLFVNAKVAEQVAYTRAKVEAGRKSGEIRRTKRGTKQGTNRATKREPSSSICSRDPLTPTSGGSESPVGGQEPGAKNPGSENPRARGRNPRSVAEKAKVAEAERRVALIAEARRHDGKTLKDGATLEHVGVYDRDRGMLTWTKVSTQRLEDIVSELTQ